MAVLESRALADLIRDAMALDELDDNGTADRFTMAWERALEDARRFGNRTTVLLPHEFARLRASLIDLAANALTVVAMCDERGEAVPR